MKKIRTLAVPSQARFIVHYCVTINDEIPHVYEKSALCEQLGLLDP